MRHGATVSQFEDEFAAYVGARYAIAAANGTVTLQAALVALGVGRGSMVATTPLTMAATSIAILNVGAMPRFHDVRPDTWLFSSAACSPDAPPASALLPVSLYGLHYPLGAGHTVDDAAQTLRAHNSGAAFTSYSFQRSKILQTGEGGMLVTDDEALAEAARSYLSLGYRLSATQSRIDSSAIKVSDYERHHRYPAINGRMNDATAESGLVQLARADVLLAVRRAAAARYQDAIAGCGWLTPQHVPDGWRHDYWTFAVACDTPARAFWLQSAVEREGGERPYAAWRLTYHEPALRHLAPPAYLPLGGYATGLCPIAESLQPRILQFQTNDRISADRNARALGRAVRGV